MNKKKIIIIGSSPYLIIEALYNIKKGNSVEIIEEKSFLGGNWCLHNYDNYISEGACHILSPPNNKVYCFLKENLGIDMQEQNPQPKIYIYNKHFKKLKHYNDSKFISILKFFKAIIFSFNTEFKISKHPKKIFKKKLNFQYPAGGSVELISKLSSLLNQNSVKISLNKKVTKINLKSKEVLCQSGNITEPHSFDKVICGFGISANEIIDSYNNKIGLKFSKKHAKHILIETGVKKKFDFSYLRIKGSAIFFRISDVTKFHKPRREGVNLYLLSCNWNYSSEVHIHNIKQLLQSLKLLNNENDNIKVIHISHRWNALLEKEKISKLNNEQFSLVYKPQGKDLNLVEAISQNVDRWKEVL
tara:strand:+ start:14 stop:1090 length:1077 start_codon:yes stop_codon:yes gene_type:complete